MFWDKRDKTDIEPLTMGLDLVNKLEPVTYRCDKRSDYKDGKLTALIKEKLCGGLLAQDVEELEREYGYKVEMRHLYLLIKMQMVIMD